jgi:hypothetical protein
MVQHARGLVLRVFLLSCVAAGAAYALIDLLSRL